MKYAYLCLILVLVITGESLSAIIPVPGGYPTIQAGIDAARDGDTVLVADGVYRGEGNTNLDFKGKAITVTSENGARNCIIDCELMSATMGFFFHSGETPESVVRGFKIIHGNNGSSGGGIYCYSSSPTIEENIIAGNLAGGDAGGIYCTDSSSPVIQNNEIIWNKAGGKGGGIYCRGGLAVIINNKISMNRAEIDGGGIQCDFSAKVTIQNNEISKNWTGGGGGGIYCQETWPGFPMIINNTIVENISEYRPMSGGIDCSLNCSPTVINTIFWANRGGQIYLYKSSKINVTYSNVQGGWPGEGNINAPPLFVDAYYSDYHLQADSPCINAGTSNGAPEDDIEGNLRDEFPDIGAHEYIGVSPFPVGDVSGDRTVSAYDASLILQYVVGLIDRFPVESPVGQAAKKFIAGEITIGELDRILQQSGYPSVFKMLEIENQLLQNYPNPFNPETWIPFKLAQDTPVTIKIYNTKGQFIQTIALGSKNAGIYTTKDKAAYWDGRDNLGQRVSSGVYFYILQAGEFRATRKMFIVK